MSQCIATYGVMSQSSYLIATSELIAYFRCEIYECANSFLANLANSAHLIVRSHGRRSVHIKFYPKGVTTYLGWLRLGAQPIKTHQTIYIYIYARITLWYSMYIYICISLIYIYILWIYYLPEILFWGFLSTNPEMQNPVLLALLNPPARPAAQSARRTAKVESTHWEHVDHGMFVWWARVDVTNGWYIHNTHIYIYTYIYIHIYNYIYIHILWFVQICTVILAVMSTSVHETSEGEPNRISSTAAVRLRSAWVCLRVGLRLKPLNIAVVSILSLDTSAGTLPLLQVVILTLRIAGWGKQAAVCVARWRGHHCRWAATFVIHSHW